MSKQSSWCHGFIPPFWWWFLTLLGLPLLFLLMNYFQQGTIENDLSNRVNAELDSANIDWAEAELNQRGRDVLLKGEPIDETAKEQARTVAQGVYGVNRVDFAVELADTGAGQKMAATDTETTTDSRPDPTNVDAKARIPVMNAAVENGQLSLQGEMGSQDTIDTLLEQANQVFGPENVASQLTVKAGLPEPQWLEQSGELFAILPRQQASLDISAAGYMLEGTVTSDTAREDTLLRARQLLGDNVMDNIQVASLPGSQLQATLQDGQMLLTGTVSSPVEAEKLTEAAIRRVGADNVNNQLQVSDAHAPAPWADAAATVITGMAPDNSAISIQDGVITLSGKVADEESRDRWFASTNEALTGTKLTVVADQLQVSPAQPADKPASDTAPSEQAADSAPADTGTATTATDAVNSDNNQLAPSAASSDTGARQACQGRLDNIMRGQSIQFQVNRTDIRNDSLAVLDRVAVVLQNCQSSLGEDSVIIEGHTDSDGSEAYNMDLSQRRADAVRQYLIRQGLPANTLKAEGFGESQPVATNSTRAGKAQNRRITFQIQQ